jgi:hypothetical protein
MQDGGPEKIDILRSTPNPRPFPKSLAFRLPMQNVLE